VDDDPEEAERKKRIIDKIKKQQQAFQAGIISGGDPKLVAASMAPAKVESGGGRGGGARGGGGDDVPYIADDGKGPWCAFCGATLKGQQVMEVGGKEFHPRCFVCAQCRKPLTGQMLTVQDRYYHPGCLQCKHCGQSLNGKQFVVNPNNKQVYCPEHGRLDKSGSSGLKCNGCKDPISGKEPVINALNAQWHQMCFVCDNCREPLVGQACVAQKGKPYCEGCYEQLFRTKCAACNTIIDGQVLELGPEGSQVSYHPGCFKCGTCSKPLKGSPFYLKGPGVYCEAHAL
jgi:actin-binding LIM protein